MKSSKLCQTRVPGCQGGSLPHRPHTRTLGSRLRLAVAVDVNAPVQSNKMGNLQSQLGTVIPPTREEKARKYWRTVYDFPEWVKHRDHNRQIRRLMTIPKSHILANIWPTVQLIGGVSAVATAYAILYQRDLLPIWCPALPDAACQAFITNTTTALSLLLVFRTNVSYGRWDEARKMWGGLLNRSRDIMRQAATLFPDDDPEAKKALARWMVSFARALRIHFQPEVTLESELSNILTPKEFEMLRSAPHKPVRAIHCIAQVIQNVDISTVHQMQMSHNLTFFHDVLGGCERLLRAPVPVSYTRHTARFLVIWLIVLPFAYVNSLGLWTTPTMMVVTAILVGIKEIGVQCEEPFGILPLDVICNRIQADVMNTLQADQDASTTQLRHVLQESMGRTTVNDVGRLPLY